jgi:hypothetical protein
MKRNILGAMYAGLLSVALTGAASAATVTVESEVPASWAAVDINATVATPLGGTWVDEPTVRSLGTVSGSRSPFEPFDGNDISTTYPGTNWEDIEYWSIGPGSEANSATMNFSSTQTGLSLLWGSVDTYNEIDFFDDNGFVETVTGSDVAVVTSRFGAAFVSITGISFNQIVLRSNTAAFEFSSITTVPLPAAAWLFGSALLGLVAVARRKRA